MIFYKIWSLEVRVHAGHNYGCISNEACVIPLPEMFYFNDVLQNGNRDCLSNAKSWGVRLLLQPSVSGVAVSVLMSGLSVDILSTFYDVFMVQ